MAKQVKQIPSTMQRVDADGRVTEGGMSWHLMPPKKDHCQICAVKHEQDEPHNAQSLYYQMAFNAMVGRSPTWADALAHCNEVTKALWKRHLTDINAWTEPPNSETPVKHHGAD